MKRKFAPASGSEERRGWDACLDVPPAKRQAAMRDVVRSMDEPGRRTWAKGWMDAWDTFGKASWDEIKRRSRGTGSISEGRLRKRGYLLESGKVIKLSPRLEKLLKDSLTVARKLSDPHALQRINRVADTLRMRYGAKYKDVFATFKSLDKTLDLPQFDQLMRDAENFAQ